MTPAGHNLDRLTREILHFEDMAISHAENAVKFKAEIGARLISAKALLPHGQFTVWAFERFGWSRSHVARHMRLARNVAQGLRLPEDASLRMALSAIAGKDGDTAARPNHPRFALVLGDGAEAVLELRTGDVEQLCATFAARALAFRRVERVCA